MLTFKSSDTCAPLPAYVALAAVCKHTDVLLTLWHFYKAGHTIWGLIVQDEVAFAWTSLEVGITLVLSLLLSAWMLSFAAGRVS